MRKNPDPGMREFVAMVAAIMALNALGIDIMLPALPAIAESLRVSDPNRAQLLISVYMLGFGFTQIVYGPLADRYGRKPILVISVALYALLSLVASFAASFTLLLAARLTQGMAGAAGRVLSTSIVRDRYAGADMARIMSLSFMVFLTVPILAPTIGQFVVLYGPWRWIFHLMTAMGLMLAIWLAFRLPETLDPANRRPISVEMIVGAVRETLTTRRSIGFALSSTAMFGALMGYINSCAQIFGDAFRAPEMLAPCFAMISLGLAIAAFSNSRLVARFGSVGLSFGALALMIVVSLLHLGWTLLGLETLTSFVLFQFLTMFCVGFAGPNLGALAMEPVGHIAGTASSVQGTISTVGAALIGLLIGQHFDGTVIPVILGTTACSVAALLLVLVARKTPAGSVAR